MLAAAHKQKEQNDKEPKGIPDKDRERRKEEKRRNLYKTKNDERPQILSPSTPNTQYGRCDHVLLLTSDVSSGGLIPSYSLYYLSCIATILIKHRPIKGRCNWLNFHTNVVIPSLWSSRLSLFSYAV
jgi:hypothetical protein